MVTVTISSSIQASSVIVRVKSKVPLTFGGNDIEGFGLVGSFKYAVDPFVPTQLYVSFPEAPIAEPFNEIPVSPEHPVAPFPAEAINPQGGLVLHSKSSAASPVHDKSNPLPLFEKLSTKRKYPCPG